MEHVEFEIDFTDQIEALKESSGAVHTAPDEKELQITCPHCGKAVAKLHYNEK